MKVKRVLYFMILLLLLAFLVMSKQQNPTSLPYTFSKQPFHIGPISADIYYTDGQSYITLDKWAKEKHKLTLSVSSSTNTATLERHDLSLVFANGRLVNMLSDYNNDSKISQSQIPIRGEGSIRYDVISFHHASALEKSANRQTSQIHLSSDRAYLLSSNFATPTMFREAQTNTQRHWKRILDQAIQQEMQLQWNHLLRHFNIDNDQYYAYPLMNLPFLLEDSSTNKLLVGKIWEAIYQNYMVGELEEKRIDPINSTMPLILINKSGGDFIMVYRTADGEEMLVKVELSI